MRAFLAWLKMFCFDCVEHFEWLAGCRDAVHDVKDGMQDMQLGFARPHLMRDVKRCGAFKTGGVHIVRMTECGASSFNCVHDRLPSRVGESLVGKADKKGQAH
jgi:hypothetical protein